MPKDDLCRACFDGVYPVELPEPELLAASSLDRPSWPRRWTPPTGSAPLVGGGGAADGAEPPVSEPSDLPDALASGGAVRRRRTPPPASTSRRASAPSS